jgi:antitoxin (DNA-binding transcriptional repressor) of toxin-antitoxin stability system
MYIRSKIVLMKVTITKFRQNLFKLVERVIAGETVEFVHQGTTVRLVIPEGSVPSKLDRLTPRQTANSKMTEKQQKAAGKKLQAEMWTEIEKDWGEI